MWSTDDRAECSNIVGIVPRREIAILAPACRFPNLRSLRLVVQDTALSRREHEFEPRRERQYFLRSSKIARITKQSSLSALFSLRSNSRHALCRYRKLHQVQVYRLRRSVSGGLLPCRTELPRDRSRGMHRLHPVRAG